MTSKIDISRNDVDIPEELECSICGDIFANAVSLKACGHTYCSICIRSYWLTTSRPGLHHQSKKECPLCRKAAGNDVTKALLVNREMQIKVKEFKARSLQLPLCSESRSFKDESPIRKRFRSRNYAAIQKNGKKELQKICKEYNLSSSGNEQELIDRLRFFECMWNAELDTIDIPAKPSELVSKFKKKERMQREEKSRDMMSGKINDSKYMKKLTSSLLDDENKRNDKTLSATSSGNAMFDAKFKSSFTALIAEGRKRMKKPLSSSPRKIGVRRIYADDGIHDQHEQTSTIDTKESNSCGNNDSINTSALMSTPNIMKRDLQDNVVETGSLDGNQRSQKKRVNVHNPYKSERKRKLQYPTNDDVIRNTQKVNTPSSHTTMRSNTKPLGFAQIKSLQPPRETLIQDTYKNNRLHNRETLPNRSNANTSVPRRTQDSYPLAPSMNSEKHVLHKLQSCDTKHRERIPLAQTKNTNAFEGYTPIQKKKIIYNPYKKNCRRN